MTIYFAAVRLDRAFLPKMLEQKSGVIIHVNTVAPGFIETKAADLRS